MFQMTDLGNLLTAHQTVSRRQCPSGKFRGGFFGSTTEFCVASEPGFSFECGSHPMLDVVEVLDYF